MANKKKLLEKVDNIKPSIQKIFENVGVNLDDDKLTNFITAFEMLKDESVKEAISPIQEKMEEYQKKNYELQVKLEESLKNNDKLDKVISEKIEEVNKIKIPQIPDIEKVISDKIENKFKLFEEKLSKLDSLISEKLVSFKIDDELKKIKDIGDLFENYKNSFVKILCDTESEEVKKLHSKLIESENKLDESNKKIVNIEEQFNKEKEFRQITLIIENSNLSDEQKGLLYKIAEKFTFEETKNEIQKTVSINEEKQKSESKSPNRQLTEESVGIKSTNDVGFIGKRRTFFESNSYKNEMDEWVNLALKDGEK